MIAVLIRNMVIGFLLIKAASGVCCMYGNAAYIGVFIFGEGKVYDDRK